MKSGCPRTVTNAANEMQVALTFITSPKKSTRRASSELGISRRSLCCLINKLNFKLYRPRLLQHLTEDDPDCRVEFADIMLNEIRQNLQFLDQDCLDG